MRAALTFTLSTVKAELHLTSRIRLAFPESCHYGLSVPCESGLWLTATSCWQTGSVLDGVAR
jgi:hypothetical protein